MYSFWKNGLIKPTFASSMITAGHNILWISQMLGHKDISITMKVYARFVKEDDEKRIENLAKINPYFN